MPRLQLALAALAAALVVAPASARAAAPPNDGAASPTPLAFGAGAAVAQSTLEATSGSEPGTGSAPAGCARMGRTVWFRLRGNGHALQVSTAGSSVDTVVAIYASPTPADGNRVACNDDVGGGDNKSRATASATVRGNTYLVQVGSKIQPACSLPADSCANGGSLKVTAEGIPRPGNDDRGAAAALATGVPATADNTGGTSEPGETLGCGATPYAATVWFRWVAPAPGTPSFNASAVFPGAAGGPVMAVYRGSAATPLGCGAAQVALTGPVAAGDTLLVQVGAAGADGPGLGEGTITVQAALAPLDGDGDGFAPPRDCNDANGLISPNAVDLPGDGIDQDCNGQDAVDLDRDRDGVARPQDCRDDRPDIHPGARDKPRDGIDQDCAGGDARLPRLRTSIVGFSSTFPDERVSRFTDLHLKDAVKGEVAKVSCKGPGCPRGKAAKTRVRRARRTLSILGPLRGAELGRGAVVTVRLTAPGALGRMARWTVRGTKVPKRIDRCLVPGAKRPAACS